MKGNNKPQRITNYPPLEGPINTIGLFHVDPMGSYNGLPADPEDTPVQDADDL